MLLRDRDYVEDRAGNILRLVGDNHDKFVIGYVKYYPSPQGDRTYNGKKYAVNTNVSNSFNIMASKPNTIRYSPHLGVCCTGCSPNEIVKVHHPKQRLKQLKSQVPKTQIEKKIRSLLDVFSEYNISLDEMGITGSFLTGMQTEHSDFDFICYGKGIAEKLLYVFKNDKRIKPYDGKLFPLLIKRRNKHMFSIPDNILHVQESRKIQGVYKGIHVNVQPLRTEYHSKDARTYTDFGNISILATITDHSEGIYAPAYYEIGEVEVLEGTESSFIRKRIREIVSFVGAYSQIVKKGERVYAKGMLLRCETEKDIFFVVSIDPWNRNFDNKVQLLQNNASI